MSEVDLRCTKKIVGETKVIVEHLDLNRLQDIVDRQSDEFVKFRIQVLVDDSRLEHDLVSDSKFHIRVACARSIFGHQI